MTTHEIHKITGDAEFSVVWEYGKPQTGFTSNVDNHTYHCRCGETFGGAQAAADHVEDPDQ